MRRLAPALAAFLLIALARPATADPQRPVLGPLAIGMTLREVKAATPQIAWREDYALTDPADPTGTVTSRRLSAWYPMDGERYRLDLAFDHDRLTGFHLDLSTNKTLALACMDIFKRQAALWEAQLGPLTENSPNPFRPGQVVPLGAGSRMRVESGWAWIEQRFVLRYVQWDAWFRLVRDNRSVGLNMTGDYFGDSAGPNCTLRLDVWSVQIKVAKPG